MTYKQQWWVANGMLFAFSAIIGYTVTKSMCAIVSRTIIRKKTLDEIDITDIIMKYYPEELSLELFPDVSDGRVAGD